MDNTVYTPLRLSPPRDFGVRNLGERQMEKLISRVEQLEKTTQQIQIDVALLTARSEHFATKAEVECLRTEQMQMRNELMGEMGNLERRIEKKFDNIDRKFDNIDRKFDSIEIRFNKLNDRLTWSIMIPAILAVIAWFVKTAVMEI